MDSLGFLINLKPYDCFTFNGKYTYSVLSKTKEEVSYIRINRSQKSDAKRGIEWNKRTYNNNPLNPLVKVYTINGNIEVFDFLPF